MPHLPLTRPALKHPAGPADLGYVEGKNIVIEYRWAEGKAERLSELSAELVSLKPDVLFTQSPQGALAAKKATTTIPIIFLGIGDPVGIGIIASLARPGGNITGLTNFSSELSGKRLKLLKESVPKISVVAVLWNGTSPGHPVVLKETEVAARSLGLTLQPLEVRIPDDFDGAFQAARSGRAQALSATWGPSYKNSAQTDIGLRGEKPAAGNVRAKRVRGSRRPHVVRPGHASVVPTRGNLRGQNLEGWQAGGLTRGASEEIGVHHQPESREADWPNDSTQRARKGGQGDQVRKHNGRTR